MRQETAEKYERVLRAFIGLEGNSDFNAIVEWFAEMDAELNRNWPNALGVEANWMQGRKQIVGAFLERRKEAPDLLATLLREKAQIKTRKKEVRGDVIYT